MYPAKYDVNSSHAFTSLHVCHLPMFCFVNARIAPAVTRSFWIYTQNRLEIGVGLCSKKIDRKLCKNTPCNEILQNILQEQWSKRRFSECLATTAAFLFKSARQPRDALHVDQFIPTASSSPSCFKLNTTVDCTPNFESGDKICLLTHRDFLCKGERDE